MTSPDPRDRAPAAAPAAHARHDTSLVAAHAAGDLSGASRQAAEGQMATCTACAALYDDLRAIARATRSLSNVTIPASAARRDFRLTPAQAARLRRGRGWRRLLESFAGSGAAWTRPLAAALTTLGLAGVLLTTVLPGLGGLASGSAATAPERPTAQSAATAGPAPAAGGVPDTGGGAVPSGGALPGAGAVTATNAPTSAVDELGPGAQPSAEAVSGGTGGRNAATAAPAPPDAGSSGTPPAYAAGQVPTPGGAKAAPSGQDGVTYEPIGQASSPRSLLVLGSVALIVVGLALFGLRLVARRLS